jgi:hypothetical protein
MKIFTQIIKHAINTRISVCYGNYHNEYVKYSNYAINREYQ